MERKGKNKNKENEVKIFSSDEEPEYFNDDEIDEKIPINKRNVGHEYEKNLKK
jgi:hypothetical protein